MYCTYITRCKTKNFPKIAIMNYSSQCIIVGVAMNNSLIDLITVENNDLITVVTNLSKSACDERHSGN